MESERPVRLRDIAEATGLSPSGVSRALNGDPTMSTATRDRVRAVAAEMGYRADPAARTLRAVAADRRVGFRGTLAYVVPEHARRQMETEENRARYPWHTEVRRRAENYGYRLDVLEYPETPREEKALNRVLRARGIPGVILAASHHDLRNSGIDWEGISAVSLYASPTEPFLTNLSVPYFQDAYLATRRLLERGYRRIGLVMIGNLLDPFIGGYEVALQAADLPVFPVLKQAKGLPPGLMDWIREHRLDCVLTSTGMELVEALEAAGLRIPEDIGVCVTDDIDRPGYLSGMAQPRELVCRWAVDTLHVQLSHHEYGPPEEPAQIQFPSVWSEGRTLKPIGQPVRSTRRKRKKTGVRAPPES